MNGMGRRLMERLRDKSQPKRRLATPTDVRAAVSEALDLVKAEQPGALLSRFTLNFVLGEWADVVDAWQQKSNG